MGVRRLGHGILAPQVVGHDDAGRRSFLERNPKRAVDQMAYLGRVAGGLDERAGNVLEQVLQIDVLLIVAAYLS